MGELLMLLRRVASPHVTITAASGLFLSVLWFWRPETRRRYWRGFLGITMFTATLWILLFGLFRL
jgi:hypothetical protein